MKDARKQQHGCKALLILTFACAVCCVVAITQELEALPVLDDANLTESLRSVTMEDFQV
jgi:hypothetical protein